MAQGAETTVGSTPTAYTRVVVTGASGFLGRHVMPVLKERYGESSVIGVRASDFDLTERGEVERLWRELRPDVVVHLAALSGGIGANARSPADFYYQNTLLLAHTFDVAARRGVQRLVVPFGGCSYPATATSPIDESQLWAGYAQAESAGYSMAKKMAVVAARSYRIQFGLDTRLLIPGNMYGEFDNFRKEESHVVPAMIRRFFEAGRDQLSHVTMWGTGRAIRDFVYAGDVARLIPFFIEASPASVDGGEPVNLSSGTATTIRELATLLAEYTAFPGELRLDTNRPDGQLEKVFAVSKMRALGLACPTPLQQGLARTVEWFSKNWVDQTDAIRL